MQKSRCALTAIASRSTQTLAALCTPASGRTSPRNTAPTQPYMLTIPAGIRSMRIPASSTPLSLEAVILSACTGRPLRPASLILGSCTLWRNNLYDETAAEPTCPPPATIRSYSRPELSGSSTHSV